MTSLVPVASTAVLFSYPVDISTFLVSVSLFSASLVCERHLSSRLSFASVISFVKTRYDDEVTMIRRSRENQLLCPSDEEREV